MKTPSKRLSVLGPAVLLALFAAGTLAGRALALPLPAYVVGMAVAVLGLRVGVMATAIWEPPQPTARSVAPAADTRGPRLRAAHG